MFLVDIANRIGKAHAKFFLFLSQKAETHPLWAIALTAWALYEIFEHIALPTLALLWATGDIGLK